MRRLVGERVLEQEPSEDEDDHQEACGVSDELAQFDDSAPTVGGPSRPRDTLSEEPV